MKPFSVAASALWISTFFTVTGFHGLHVLAGLIVMAIFFVLGRQRTLSTRQSDVLSAVGYYWHFVDVVWVALFLAIFVLK